MNATQTIDALGGTVKVARELGLTPSTVSSWKNRPDRVPRWRVRDVVDLAERMGVALPESAAS